MQSGGATFTSDHLRTTQGNYIIEVTSFKVDAQNIQGQVLIARLNTEYYVVIVFANASHYSTYSDTVAKIINSVTFN